jgi:benzoyl-CoA reductase/2-hydroxyglutaryl-CoA dehydratase subunit BcrC/BadD/HgdB
VEGLEYFERKEGFTVVPRIESPAFQELSAVASALANPGIEEWKEQGGKVLGYFCSSMPEEILTAAGLLPFRMRATGSTDTELSDAHLSSINCSFTRHCLNAALSGDLDFLDGLIVPNSCDNVRRIYDHWIRQMKTPFVRMVSLPRKAGPAQVDWFREELHNLKDRIEEHFGVEIPDARMRNAIRLHNETRRLQRRLYDMRKAIAPPINGAETLTVTVAGTAMAKTRYNRLLTQLLDDLSTSEGCKGYRARLMVMGGELDDPAYVEAIEEQGGLVVTDSLCYGSRMLWKDVDEGADDPIEALARFYVSERPSCPRVFGEYEQRAAFLREMIRDFQVDGVILERLAFCDLWGFEQFTIQNDFQEWGIPLMMLDREYTLGGIGQLRTRVQAFLETIEEGESGSEG